MSSSGKELKEKVMNNPILYKRLTFKQKKELLSMISEEDKLFLQENVGDLKPNLVKGTAKVLLAALITLIGGGLLVLLGFWVISAILNSGGPLYGVYRMPKRINYQVNRNNKLAFYLKKLVKKQSRDTVLGKYLYHLFEINTEKNRNYYQNYHLF